MIRVVVFLIAVGLLALGVACVAVRPGRIASGGNGDVQGSESMDFGR